MKTINSSVPSAFAFVFHHAVRAVLFARYPILLLATACEYTPPQPDICSLFEAAPLKEAIGDTPVLVFNDPGQRFAIFHGSACAESNEDEQENIIKVQQNFILPTFANRATVFLNGWRLRYLSKDHEIEGLGTIIGKIALSSDSLTWQAAGILSDKNFDDAYRWCYNFTIIAWDDLGLAAIVDHDDTDSFCNAGSGVSDNFFFAPNEGTTTALSSFSTFVQNLELMQTQPGTVAVLPRGFGFDGDGNHHLLQIAYNLDHGEGFIEQGRTYSKAIQNLTIPSTALASHADSGFVSWDAHAIFKDNEKRRQYSFGEMVSVLGGGDVGVVQSPYSVLPEEDGGWGSGCITSGQPDVLTEEFTIENLPFECAIPMLTGWELAYACDDEQVTEIGVSIDEWTYEAGGQGGTLRYKLSSALRDRDNEPEHKRSHKVTILGLRPLGGGQNAAAQSTRTGGQ